MAGLELISVKTEMKDQQIEQKKRDKKVRNSGKRMRWDDGMAMDG